MFRKSRIFILIMLIAIICLLVKTSLRQKNKYIREFLISDSLASYSLIQVDTINKENDILFIMGTDTKSEGSGGLSTYRAMNPYTVLNRGNGILFVETTDKIYPSSLVLCAIESAARVYPDRPVVFFMKGLNDITIEESRIRKYFPTLSSYNNVYFFPLKMGELFMYTPLVSWYKKVSNKMYGIKIKMTPHFTSQDKRAVCLKQIFFP